MKKMKTSLFTLLCLAIIFSLAIPISSPAKASLATVYVDDDLADYPAADFTRIQDAVTAASAGDTIIVYPGTYTENVDVNKDHLTIQSENGAESTIVQAANPDDHVFEVTADYVTIEGFTVKETQMTGIYLQGTEFSNIINNKADENSWGIRLIDSDANKLIGNLANSCSQAGIELSSSTKNTLKNNNTSLGQESGICLVDGSNNNIVISNIASSGGHGIHLENSSGNILYLNNFIDNGSNVYSMDSTNIWNSPEEITYTYNGNTYTNYLGNYWSDYGTYLPPVGHSDLGAQWEDEPLAYDGDINTYARVYVASIDTSWLELLAPSGKTTQGIRFWGSGGPLRVDIYYDGGWHCLRDWSWGISSAPGNEWVELTYPSKIVEKARIKFHGRVLRGWSHLHEFQFITVPSDADGDGIWDNPYSIDGDKDDYSLVEPFENYEIGLANQPPVADAGSDQSVSSGDLVYFDGSNSYDPDGTIVTYGWEFADGEAAKGCKVSHPFRGAMDEPKTYTVTLTVRDDKGTFSTDSISVTVAPLGKTVEVTRIPRTPAETEAFAKMKVSYNWVDTRNGEDVYVVSRIRCSCLGFLGGYSLFILDTHSHPEPTVIWWDILSSQTETKTYASPFATSVHPSLSRLFPNWEPCSSELRFYGEDFFEGFEVYGSDVMSIRATGWPEGYYFGTDWRIIMVEMLASTFFEEDSAYFQPQSAEVPSIPIDINDLNLAGLCSPGELRVYDSEGRVTGLVNGEVEEVIPDSVYVDDTVVIFSPSYPYRYEVVGREDGAYGVVLASVEDGDGTTFTAIDIPTASGAVHQYSIDWDALSEDEGEVTVQVDSDGDGVFERTITEDNELTGDEFILQTATTIDFDPDTLNLKGKGKYVTVYIELPLGYDVSQIDVSSIMLNEVIPALTKPTEIDDYDGDGIPDLMVKFDRVAVQEILTAGDQVEITISGEVAGIDFEGRGNIRVMGD